MTNTPGTEHTFIREFHVVKQNAVDGLINTQLLLNGK
jgi:hypothetical protein